MLADTIIERAKAKDPKALNEIYATYYPKMAGVCRKIAKEDEETVRDLVHDAFVLAFASLDKLRNNERLGEWLTTIVRNVALKHVAQKDKIHFVPLPDVDSSDAALRDDSSQADSAINCGDILQAISQLPEGYGKVVRLSVVEGFSHKEIASMLGIEPHSSSSQLARAKGMLRQMLGYKQLAMLVACFALVPLCLVLSRRDEPDVCEMKQDRRKMEETEAPASAKRQEAETKDNGKAADKHGVRAARSEDTYASAVTSAQDADDEGMMAAEAGRDSIRTELRDSIEVPTERQEPLLAAVSRQKKNGWKLRAAGSFGPALAQNASKWLQTEGIGDIGTDAPSSVFPENVSTWEDYSSYLHLIRHENTPADTLALTDIADHNTGDIVEREEHNQPVSFGISLCKTLTDRWSIETGIQYSLLSSRFAMGENGYSMVKRQKAHYLGVPLRLYCQLADYRHLSAYSSVGITVHVPVYGRRDGNYIVGWQSAYSDSRHFTPAFQWQTSLSVGVQYRFSPGVSLFIEPTLNWFIPSGSETHTIWTEHPVMFTSPLGVRLTW